jgi:hypothetical protein
LDDSTVEGKPEETSLKENEVNRQFQLDYFNFPVVDNTRLSSNHRFAIVMEEFSAEVTDEDPHLEISGIIFPAEYASLKDRPGMKEAMQLLKTALDNKEPEGFFSWGNQ